MEKLKTRLLTVVGVTSLAVVANFATGTDPCGYGGQGGHDYSTRDTVSSCHTRWYSQTPPIQVICSLMSPNWGKNQTCDFWCCYDANGHFQDRKLGDCESCDYNNGCCNQLKGCNEAAQSHLGAIACLMDR